MKRLASLAFCLAHVAAALAAAPHWHWCGWGGGGSFWSAAADPSDGNVFYMGGDVVGL